ncbi:hypothetical protein ACQPZX_02750 [Actinoplanes sp. CA-142083]|uniref:hypothetical protein n=1 Tax=Actinoplanes sp. CA-142083 TaxID=3239903 RepID=UPI003D8B8800
MLIQLALAALSAMSLPTAIPAPEPRDPPRPVPVALSAPTRLVQTAHDLYWTAGTTVYRTSKNADPGQENVLYTESGAGRNFGALVYADGIYVVVNADGASQIKRVPGGEVVATPEEPIGVRDLVTDGRLLIWPDAHGVRAVPIRGGPVHTLAQGSGITHLALDGGTLYYAEGKRIHRIGLEGEALFATADRAVTSLYARGGVVFYGSADGSVWRKAEGEAAVVLRPATDGRTVASVFSDGRRVLWSDCSTSAPECAVGTWLAGYDWSFLSGPRTHDVLADPHATYFGDASGVWRFSR